MTKYNTVYCKYNVKLFYSKLNKLKSGIINGTQLTINLSSNVIGHANGETNFSHKLLLTNTEVSNILKAFANGSTANTKVSKF